MHKTTPRRIAQILLPAIILPILGALVGMATARNVQTWYNTLEHSALTPPDPIFGIVWTALYILMGIAFGLILTGPDLPQKKNLLRLFIAQLILNLSWSFLFFHLHLLWISTLWIIALGGMVMILIIRLWKFRHRAALLLLPYAAWLCFAFYLSLIIALRN